MPGLCGGCGVLTSKGPRCAAHAKREGANHAIHTDPRWAALSKRMIARHVGQFGWVCLGDGTDHPAHPSRDLTTDHVVELQDGGAPFDEANTRILCRSWNSTTGARRANERRAGRMAPRLPAPLSERAQIRARYLG